MEPITAKSFCENVNNLITRRHLGGEDGASCNMISNKVTVKLNVLPPFMKNSISCNVLSILIVTMRDCRTIIENTQLTKKCTKLGTLANGTSHGLIFMFS
ncbi:unnamed protein product [Linum trigynum]|uniref:Uncharacterized protein n=1 Tax=Linum trigynum TaxID=586398 RepID=A0AAV2CK61_9ROSI